LRRDHQVYISLKAYIDLKGRLSKARPRERMSYREMLDDDELLAERERIKAGRGGDDCLRLVARHPELILVGDAGGGKTTAAREWQYRLADAILGRGEEVPRLPLVVRASTIADGLRDHDPEKPLPFAAALDREPDELTAGAVHLTVDALNELDDESKQRVGDWILALRKAYPRTRVLACHRQYGYVPGLLPFPLITLDKVDQSQVREYVIGYFREHHVEDHEALAGQLLGLLLEDPEHQQVRDLAQTPLFLWMIVERYRQTKTPPRGRGELFEDFARWYLQERHREEHHKEPPAITGPYEPKAELLARLGYEMVQRGVTALPEEHLAGLHFDDGWQAVLEECVRAEMLHRTDGKLRFLHQSFQEYFAARWFLDHEATDQPTVQQRVWRLGWHETFAVLLGFAGESQEVVSWVIEAALQVNRVLTARCLRMAELPDHTLLDRFVADQAAVLADPGAGKWAHEQATRALAEHGRGPTRAALLEVARGSHAPDAARVLAIEELAGMPKQARFEPVAEKTRGELHDCLEEVFNQEAPAAVTEAAIEAAVTVELTQLSPYLLERLQEADWPVRRAAWDALEKLKQTITPKQRAGYVKACRDRLDETEAELYKEAVLSRMSALNEERVAILRQLADPKYLDLLL
ncbi:MAG: NACHT domain-containing protein, partial [Planctomycetota bacterium]